MKTFWSAEDIIRLKNKGVNTDLLNLNQPLKLGDTVRYSGATYDRYYY